jgi:predicted transcriptional regulator
MKLAEILEVLEGELLTEGVDLNEDISCAAGADLMSDVLSFGKPGAILLTGLTNPQVVRTAEMADIAGIVFVRGKRPPQETIALAREKRIPLIAAPYTLFEMCGRLYQHGMIGCDLEKRPASGHG